MTTRRRLSANRALLREFLPAEPQLAAAGARQHRRGRCRPACSIPSKPMRRNAGHPGSVCAVMVADCLPVLLADRAGSVVAAAHAGWRGLAAGVIENTVESMAVPPRKLVAYLGPAIGPVGVRGRRRGARSIRCARSRGRIRLRRPQARQMAGRPVRPRPPAACRPSAVCRYLRRRTLHVFRSGGGSSPTAATRSPAAWRR